MENLGTSWQYNSRGSFFLCIAYSQLAQIEISLFLMVDYFDDLTVICQEFLSHQRSQNVAFFVLKVSLMSIVLLLGRFTVLFVLCLVWNILLAFSLRLTTLLAEGSRFQQEGLGVVAVASVLVLQISLILLCRLVNESQLVFFLISWIWLNWMTSLGSRNSFYFLPSTASSSVPQSACSYRQEELRFLGLACGIYSMIKFAGQLKSRFAFYLLLVPTVLDFLRMPSCWSVSLPRAHISMGLVRLMNLARLCTWLSLGFLMLGSFFMKHTQLEKKLAMILDYYAKRGLDRNLAMGFTHFSISFMSLSSLPSSTQSFSADLHSKRVILGPGMSVLIKFCSRQQKCTREASIRLSSLLQNRKAQDFSMLRKWISSSTSFSIDSSSSILHWD